MNRRSLSTKITSFLSVALLIITVPTPLFSEGAPISSPWEGPELHVPTKDALRFDEPDVESGPLTEEEKKVVAERFFSLQEGVERSEGKEIDLILRKLEGKVAGASTVTRDSDFGLLGELPSPEETHFPKKELQAPEEQPEPIVLSRGGSLPYDRREPILQPKEEPIVSREIHQNLALIAPLYLSYDFFPVSSPQFEAGLTEVGELLRDQYSTIHFRIGKEAFDRSLFKLYAELLKNLLKQSSGAPGPKQFEGDYVILDSVTVGPELAAVHFILHPPADLHPYLRVLLYRRLVTPALLRWYLETTQKIDGIYKRVKAGEGEIRYKGKVREVYLPLPDEMGGPYELVVQAKQGKIVGPAPRASEET